MSHCERFDEHDDLDLGDIDMSITTFPAALLQEHDLPDPLQETSSPWFDDFSNDYPCKDRRIDFSTDSSPDVEFDEGKDFLDGTNETSPIFLHLVDIPYAVLVHDASPPPGDTTEETELAMAILATEPKAPTEVAQAPAPAPKRKHECGECCKTLPSSSALAQHLRVHSKEKPFACITCSKCFSQKANLQEHIKSVHLLLTHHCDLCGNGFTNRSNLFKHLRTAETCGGKKTAPCDLCGGAGFCSNYELKRHCKTPTHNKRKAELWKGFPRR
ncbi:hypothetical protein T484DRAFT_1851028 [Baffinella frigidus]|nr:hypothetical protein T484DRAFT_1851028 [Cryptophyta sp. CCMP2293]